MEFVYEDRYPFGRAVPALVFAGRRRALQDRLRAEGFSGAVVRGGACAYGHLAYLTNHVPPSGAPAALYLPAQGEVTLYADAYRPDLVAVERVESLSHLPPPGERVALLGPALAGLPSGEANACAPCAAAGEWLAEARMLKTPPELDVLEDAARVGAVGLEAARAMILPGASERHVGAAAISAAIRAGADGARCAVRTGLWAHRPARWPDASDELIAMGQPVLVDLKGSYQGFRFRIARTFFLGAADPRDAGAGAAAERALAAFLGALRPGAPLASACRAAEETAANDGYVLDPALGHGIGLDPVEAPALGRSATAVVWAGLALSLTLRVNSAWLVQGVAVTGDGARVLGRFPL